MGSATSAENTEHDEEAPQSSETETQNQRWVPQMVSGAVEGAVLTRRRARERFEEGLRDGEELLRRDTEDALFVA